MDFRILFLMVILPWAASLSFNFTSFDSSNNLNIITYKGDAGPVDSVIQLHKPETWRSGHAISAKPMHLWDKPTGKLADFTTHFSFSIEAQTNITPADGFAFFIASLQFHVPDVPDGSGLGLAVGNHIHNSTDNPFVSVEFDTFHNDWDPENYHVGINVNSLASSANVTWQNNVLDGRLMDAWINYNSSLKLLQVSFTGFTSNTTIQQSLQYEVDLRDYLSEWAIFGFASATGVFYELDTIHSWYFTSRLKISENKKGNNISIGLVVGYIVAASCILLGVLCLILILMRKWKSKGRDYLTAVQSIDREFERVTGAKKMKFSKLVEATNNFARELGEGGFGKVYEGILKDLNSEYMVAVKRISTSSSQGIKEYASEVIIASRLRHKNLVQLIGWCHEKKDLLLVYELMSRGSLESNLFNRQRLLEWTERYKIAQELASSLHYLHFQCEPCVLHRDIKASNVLLDELDSNLTAKLGDFGLARLVSPENAWKHTLCAGTFGYIAPEYESTGTASRETDVYSFGIVALEISCGRHAITLNSDRNRINIVPWLWEFYARGKLVEAADPRLEGRFDKQQMERLMIIGMCCAHPDSTCRPSMEQVTGMLNFQVSPPILPLQMPVPNNLPQNLNFST